MVALPLAFNVVADQDCCLRGWYLFGSLSAFTF